jgi:hypothetical protein
MEPISNEFLHPWLPHRLGKHQALAQQVGSTDALSNNINHSHRLVYAPHFYDLNVLFNKYYAWVSVNVQELSRGMFILKALHFGAQGLRKNYREQMSTIIKRSHPSLGVGRVPVLIGEVGIPFDLIRASLSQRDAMTSRES